MQMRKTNDGTEISALGFGAMRLPKLNGRIDKKMAKELIYYAIDHGVNFIDTALLYHEGNSESFLGEILKDGYRDKVKLCTKAPAWAITEYEDMEKYLKLQFEKLQTDCIDYYLLHNLNEGSFFRLKELGILDYLESAKEEGKITHIGFSFHDSTMAFKKIVDAYTWDVCLIQFNFLDENSQAGRIGLEYAASQGITVLVMGPLKGGILAEAPEEALEIWSKSKVKRTPAEWALRWVLNYPDVTCVLSGMGELEQVKMNIKVANKTYPNSIPDDEMKLYNEVKKVYEEQLKVECTGCGYCMPCPSEVDIPQCFTLYNQKHMFKGNFAPDYLYLTVLGGASSGNQSYAGLCNGCGNCVKVCPQKLDVPLLLKEVSHDMEGRDFLYKVKAAELRLTKKRESLN
jgi:predicted aldo/keto reductase-like oxidoreductase